MIDNDEKMGGAIDDIDIISLNHLKQLYKKILIQISSIFDREIEKQLKANDINSFISFEEYSSRRQAFYI